MSDLRGALLNLAMTNIRTVMGSMVLDDLPSHRGRINTQLLSVVDEATSAWGVKVTRIEILKIQPPHDLAMSMARQMKAERDKRATILEAEGRREAAFRESEARERAAEAEAKATRDVSSAIAGGDLQAINSSVSQKHLDALRLLADSPNQKILFVPPEASGTVGALGSAVEIVREALGRRSSARTTK